MKSTKVKYDLLLLSAVLLASVLLMAALKLFSRNGSRIEVWCENEQIGSYSLMSDAEIPIETGFGRNVLIIHNGSAYVTEASCPDGICIGMGKICKAGESIVCLPNRLVISVEDGKTETDLVIR